MLRGAADRRDDAWKRTANLSAFIYNFAGFRPDTFRTKRPEELYPDLYGYDAYEDFKEDWEAAEERERRLIEMRERKKKRKQERQDDGSGTTGS